MTYWFAESSSTALHLKDGHPMAIVGEQGLAVILGDRR